MPVDHHTLYNILCKGFPNSKIKLVDIVGDSNHYEVEITSTKFNHLTVIQQHKLVHQTLKQYLETDLHALSIKTFKTE